LKVTLLLNRDDAKGRGEYREVAGTAGPQLKSYMATDAARATRLAALLAGRGACGDHPHKGIAKGIKI
jgi:hypothetical protein